MALRVSPGATVYLTGRCPPGTARTVPGRMTSGSAPITRRLAAYSARQPPRTPRAAAMALRVSPGRTTQVTERPAVTLAAVTAARRAGALAA